MVLNIRILKNYIRVSNLPLNPSTLLGYSFKNRDIGQAKAKLNNFIIIAFA